MNKILKNTIILTVITLIAGLGLGFVYEITKDPIAQAQDKAKKEAWQAVFPEADINEFEAVDVDEKVAEAAIKAVGAKATVDEVCKVGEEGYVITTTDKEGYGGDIKFSVGVDMDLKVTGISYLTIAETAGLGMKAKDSDFINQYIEGSNSGEGDFIVNKDGTDGIVIDAISGATITSRAVTKGVNAACQVAQNLQEGGSDHE